MATRVTRTSVDLADALPSAANASLTGGGLAEGLMNFGASLAAPIGRLLGAGPQSGKYLVRTADGEWVVDEDELADFIATNPPQQVRPISADDARKLTGAATEPATGGAPSAPVDFNNLTGEQRQAMLAGQRARRNDRLQQVIARESEPRRADRDADLLAGSLQAPLVVNPLDPDQPFAVQRESRLPWARDAGEFTETIVGYSELDVLVPATWANPDKVGRLQTRLVNAGVLAGDFKWGDYDDLTQAAYRELLTRASQAGLTSTQMLSQWRQAEQWARENGMEWGVKGQQARSAYAPRVPDIDVLKQSVRAIFGQQLPGVELQTELLRELARDYQGEFTRVYEENRPAQLDADASLFEQHMAQQAQPEPPSQAEMDQTAQARFLERFQERTGAAQERVEGFDDRQRSSAIITGASERGI